MNDKKRKLFCSQWNNAFPFLIKVATLGKRFSHVRGLTLEVLVCKSITWLIGPITISQYKHPVGPPVESV